MSTLSVKVINTVTLEDMQVLVFFENGEVKKFNIKALIPQYPEFEILKNPEVFNSLRVEPGGYGISWNEDLDCSEGELFTNGITVFL